MPGGRRPEAGALVLGANYRGLGMVRSLGRRGAPVWVALTDEHRVACASRYVRRTIRCPSAGDERAAALVALARREGLSDWVLFPTDDETGLFLARHAGVLERRSAFPSRGPRSPMTARRWRRSTARSPSCSSPR
jgi:predicted ATP-grasp superfamily ATP-dependent carboligase